MLVMNNQRRLSLPTARSVCRAMKKSKPEADEFLEMVRLELCKSPEETASMQLALKVAIQRIVAQSLPHDKAAYLSKWYISLIRELAFLPDFNADPKWIARRLRGLVSEQQAARATAVLTKLELWKQGPDGKITVIDKVIDTGPESIQYAKYKVTDIHGENLRAWAKIFDQIQPEDRELGLINIPISEDRIPELKRRIRVFQDEIIGWLMDVKSPTKVVQLGTYLVPITTEE